MKDLVEAGSNELATVSEFYGATDNITTDDIRLGRIAWVNALSEIKKQNEDIKTGAIYNTITGELLADRGETLEFIPIYSRKYWVEKDGDQFLRAFPASSPKDMEWQEGTIKRHFTHSFYVLLVSEIDLGMVMPLELAFRSTDLAAARTMSSFLLKLKMNKKASWHNTFLLSTVKKQKDKYEWYGASVKPGRATTQEEIVEAVKWGTMLRENEKNIAHDTVSDEKSQTDGVTYDIEKEPEF